MGKFLIKLKEKKITKWIAIYISTAITIIGITNILSTRYDWAPFIFDFIFFTLFFGVASVIIISWFHGEEGRQKIKLVEIIFHTLIFTGLITTLYFVADFGKKKIENSNEKVIAVLPFSDFNETKENEFFADGITDDILTQLSKISDIKVISRTSVMKYKNTKMNISEISKELGAGTILEGSVRTSGNKIRITGQLIDANNDVHIWSETFDREMNDVFEIQTDIAERIAAALHAKLLPGEKELIENKNTNNFDAYTFYLKGKHHYYNYTEEENEMAIDQFKKALNIDPNYALAIAGLSDAYSQKVSKYWAENSWLDSALVLGKKAVEKNPKLPEAYKALASAYQGKEEIQLAMLNYKKAIELNPNYWTAILNYGQIKMFFGKYDEALFWIKRAAQLSPDDIMSNLSVAMVYKNLNCNNIAINWAQKALSLEPRHTFANSYLGDLYLNVGDIKNARKYFESSVEIDSNWVFGWFLGGRIEAIQNDYKKSKIYFDRYMKIRNSYPEYFYAHTLLKLNQVDSAKSILEEEVKDYSTFFEEEEKSQLFNYMAFAEIYAVRNDRVNSYKWWNKAINKGYTDIERIKIYPYFENMRNEPEYKSLLQKMRTKIDSFKTVIKNEYPEYEICE
ncbi:MAG: hypothetical protein KDC90_10385 [Ignavibacteriae bacterium]|nr:hypothetical protein [Ignavibacteriota bacterium]